MAISNSGGKKKMNLFDRLNQVREDREDLETIFSMGEQVHLSCLDKCRPKYSGFFPRTAGGRNNQRGDEEF
jgi:hypothetical protein